MKSDERNSSLDYKPSEVYITRLLYGKVMLWWDVSRSVQCCKDCRAWIHSEYRENNQMHIVIDKRMHTQNGSRTHSKVQGKRQDGFLWIHRRFVRCTQTVWSICTKVIECIVYHLLVYIEINIANISPCHYPKAGTNCSQWQHCVMLPCPVSCMQCVCGATIDRLHAANSALRS